MKNWACYSSCLISTCSLAFKGLFGPDGSLCWRAVWVKNIWRSDNNCFIKLLLFPVAAETGALSWSFCFSQPHAHLNFLSQQKLQTSVISLVHGNRYLCMPIFLFTRGMGNLFYNCSVVSIFEEIELEGIMSDLINKWIHTKGVSAVLYIEGWGQNSTIAPFILSE